MTTNELPPASVNGCALTAPADDMTDEVRARVRQIVVEHHRRPDELIQVLHEAQALLGWLPHEMIAIVAGEMQVPYSRVSGVVTFYSLFTTEPRGRHTINACEGTACYVRGGRDVLEKLSETLGIAEGETTPDRLFSLSVVRCVGACGLAPVVTVDADVHKRVNPNKINDVLKGYDR